LLAVPHFVIQGRDHTLWDAFRGHTDGMERFVAAADAGVQGFVACNPVFGASRSRILYVGPARGVLEQHPQAFRTQVTVITPPSANAWSGTGGRRPGAAIVE